MSPEHIVTGGDLMKFVRHLSKSDAEAYQGTLEEYLRSVLRVATDLRDMTPTNVLIGRILFEAFTAEPMPFDETWLNCTTPSQLVYQPETKVEDQCGELEHMLRFQIADLHRMKEAGVFDNPNRYYGVKSPTGHDWYNFDVASFLACSCGGGKEDYPGTECSWDELVIQLWLGEIYE